VLNLHDHYKPAVQDEQFAMTLGHALEPTCLFQLAIQTLLSNHQGSGAEHLADLPVISTVLTVSEVSHFHWYGDFFFFNSEI